MFDYVFFYFLDDLEIFILLDVLFLVKFGEIIGILGEIGLGKIILVNLIVWFYDLIKGIVYIDGKDVKSYFVCKLWENIFMVM